MAMEAADVQVGHTASVYGWMESGESGEEITSDITRTVTDTGRPEHHTQMQPPSMCSACASPQKKPPCRHKSAQDRG